MELLWYVASIFGGTVVGHLVGYYYVKTGTGINPLLEVANTSQPEILKELESEE